MRLLQWRGQTASAPSPRTPALNSQLSYSSVSTPFRCFIADAKEEAARILERAGVEAELEKKKAADEHGFRNLDLLFLNDLRMVHQSAKILILSKDFL